MLICCGCVARERTMLPTGTIVSPRRRQFDRNYAPGTVVNCGPPPFARGEVSTGHVACMYPNQLLNSPYEVNVHAYCGRMYPLFDHTLQMRMK